MEMQQIQRFVMNGVFAAKEIQDISKSLQTPVMDLLAVEAESESTDPSWYSEELIGSARRMASIYLRLYLFERKVRVLVGKVLVEAKGKDWFETAIPETIRKEAVRRQQEEGMARFHGHRGASLLDYVGLPDLGKVIEQNWDDFEEILYRKDWLLGKFEELRLTRNATAHMGELTDEDLERLDVVLRDWNRQVG